MNVYDFDDTIYYGDSTIDFYKFCVRSHPILIKYLPIQIYGILKYLLGICDKKQCKQNFFVFLKGIDAEILVEEFWKKNIKNIKKWYIQQKLEDDVVISASPMFLLEPVCKKIGINHLIASEVNIKTGEFYSENCYGKEKVIRYCEKFKNKKIDKFYTDSMSDIPLIEIAKESYIVKNDILIQWNTYNKFDKFLALKQFIKFVLIGCVNALNGIWISSIFSLLFQANIAFIIGYSISLTISYLLNSVVTFHEKICFNKFVKFCIGYIPNFFIQNCIVGIFYNYFGFDKIFVYILAAVIGVPITFVCIKILKFGKC